MTQVVGSTSGLVSSTPFYRSPRRIAFVGLCMVVFIGFNPLMDRARLQRYDTVTSNFEYLYFTAICMLTAATIGVKRLFEGKSIANLLVSLVYIWSIIGLFSSNGTKLHYLNLIFDLSFVLSIGMLVMEYEDQTELFDDIYFCLLSIFAMDILAVASFPELAIHQIDDAVEDNLMGAWRGVHEHKGVFGRILLYAVPVFFFRYRISGKVLDLIFAGGAWVLMLLAHAKAALILSIPGVLVVLMVAKAQAEHAIDRVVLWITVGGVVLAGLLAVLVANWSEILIYFFGDDTLSGRTLTWSFVLYVISENPLFGVGFSSNSIPTSNPMALSQDAWLKYIGHAHNGYLDVAMQIGIPGLVLTTLTFFVIPLKKLFSSRLQGNVTQVWASFVILSILAGFTDPNVFQTYQPAWLMLLIAVFAAQKAGVRNPRGTGSSTRLPPPPNVRRFGRHSGSGR